MRVIPNGVDLVKFRPSPRGRGDDARPCVVLVGRLIFNKGPQCLVEAAPLVWARHPNVEFVMVGDGPLMPSLQAMVEQRELSFAFSFLGVRTDVHAILRNCTLLVRPSLSEGLPLTVLEAMACGLPVVATPVGGTAEVVKDGVTGYLVEPKSPRQLAEAICRLLDDPAMAARMAANGRSLVERNHSWDRAAEETLNLYRELASSGETCGVSKTP